MADRRFVLDTDVLVSSLLLADGLRREAGQVEIIERIVACRDAADDRFLEVAVNGRADIIDTGDADLLALDPFRGIAILTPDAFLVQPQV